MLKVAASSQIIPVVVGDRVDHLLINDISVREAGPTLGGSGFARGCRAVLGAAPQSISKRSSTF